MPVQSTCPGGQDLPTVRPHHGTRALELPKNEASKGRCGIAASCTRTADPVLLASAPDFQRLTSLPSDLIPSALPWAHCFSHNRSLLLFSQGHSCLRNFALAALSAWCSLFPGYQQGSFLQVFTQMTPRQWCLQTVLSKNAVLLYPYTQREGFLS